jgi:hypothetical protein
LQLCLLLLMMNLLVKFEVLLLVWLLQLVHWLGLLLILL